MAAAREVLKTERLELEPVSPAHAEALFQAVLDSRPELLPWMPWAREPSLEATRHQTENSTRAWRQDGEFHYWIRSDDAGHGLTTEACRALVDWARRTLGLRRLTLWAGRDNAASRRVATKLGFAHVGPLDWRPEGGLGRFDAESYELPLPRSGGRVGEQVPPP